jgi:hypothetical protein
LYVHEHYEAGNKYIMKISKNKKCAQQRGNVNFSRLKDWLFDSTLGQGKQQASRF